MTTESLRLAKEPASIRAKSVWSRVGRSLLISSGLLASMAVGYYWGSSRGEGLDTSLPVQKPVPFEYYLSQPSFSEVENTRAELEALATQFLTELRARHDVSALGPAVARRHKGSPLYVVEPGRAVEEIEKGREQFRAPEPEMALGNELLYLLKKLGLKERWLDVYLGYLYEHPTQPLTGRWAKDAVAMSYAVGRQLELVDAFDLVRRIPFDFSGKAQVLTGLEDLGFAGAGLLPDSSMVAETISEEAERVGSAHP